jgi:ribosomal-protein-alanine N-acetyltransferase
VEVVLSTPRLVVRTLREADAAPLLAYHQRNAEHLRPWQPAPPAEFYTLAYWQHFIASNRGDAGETRVRFAAFEPNAPDVVAIVNLQGIERGAGDVAVLGYSVDAAAQGKGLAREAVGAVVEYAFGTLGLHRIEANYQPNNDRSGKLLRALGFVVEGYARDYLFIDGRWRDHILTSRTIPSPGL